MYYQRRRGVFFQQTRVNCKQLRDVNGLRSFDGTNTRNGEDEKTVLHLGGHLLGVGVQRHLEHLLEGAVASLLNEVAVLVGNHLLLSLSLDQDLVVLHGHGNTVLGHSRHIGNDDIHRRGLCVSQMGCSNLNQIDIQREEIGVDVIAIHEGG